MNKKAKLEKESDFQSYLSEQLKNPTVKRNFDEYGKQLEVAYQVLQIRKQQGLSQAQLAERLDTTQSNVARIESGQQNFTVQLLARIAKACKKEVKIAFV